MKDLDPEINKIIEGLLHFLTQIHFLVSTQILVLLLLLLKALLHFLVATQIHLAEETAHSLLTEKRQLYIQLMSSRKNMINKIC